MSDSVRDPVSLPRKLILASQSPRRRELLQENGYTFESLAPSETAEEALPDGPPHAVSSPEQLVVRLARQKAADVAARVSQGIVLGCDTVAECHGYILGKPRDLQHAREMLQLLRGQEHRVLSGVCLWLRPEDDVDTAVDVTRLRMDTVSDADLEEYLATGQWEGKAGAFGYQDRLDWIHIVSGSESNVVGLPMELLERMLLQHSIRPEPPAHATPPDAVLPHVHLTLHRCSAPVASTGRYFLHGAELHTLALPGPHLLEPLPIGFDATVERLAEIDTLFVEMDGSFTWGSLPHEAPSWRLDGNLFERGDQLAYIDVKGRCALATWQRLIQQLFPVPSSRAHLVVQCVEAGVFATWADFERWALRLRQAAGQ